MRKLFLAASLVLAAFSAQAEPFGFKVDGFVWGESEQAVLAKFPKIEGDWSWGDGTEVQAGMYMFSFENKKLVAMTKVFASGKEFTKELKRQHVYDPAQPLEDGTTVSWCRDDGSAYTMSQDTHSVNRTYTGWRNYRYFLTAGIGSAAACGESALKYLPGYAP
jgi:hypothetical protein